MGGPRPGPDDPQTQATVAATAVGPWAPGGHRILGQIGHSGQGAVWVCVSVLCTVCYVWLFRRRTWVIRGQGGAPPALSFVCFVCIKAEHIFYLHWPGATRWNAPEAVFEFVKAAVGTADIDATSMDLSSVRSCTLCGGAIEPNIEGLEVYNSPLRKQPQLVDVKHGH